MSDRVNPLFVAPNRPYDRAIMRAARQLLVLLLMLLPACQKGVSKGARLASERLTPHVAQLDGVPAAQVTVTIGEEIFRNMWFAKAKAKTEWSCFVDVFAIFCDHGEGKIFADLVAHRRLGDNRASVDDPAWIQLVRNAYGLKSVYPDKDFPLDTNKDKLKHPRVERPTEGGVQITIFALDKNDKTLRLEVDVEGEGTVIVRRAPLP